MIGHNATTLRICLIHVPPPLRQAFLNTGHEILVFNPAPGRVCDLPRELEQRGFRPDILVQKEALAPRTPLHGLWELDCLKIYWAIDPHLNAFWQCAYGRLFDLFFATQKGWDRELLMRGLEQVHWLPWHGAAMDWLPWSARQHHMTFAGRVTAERPVRKAFLEALDSAFPGSLNHVDGVSFDDMIEIYRHSRIAPNESILGEINFRLFEGASCGCAVLGQDLGEAQAALFEPGVEMETFGDVLELREKAARLLAEPRRTQTMARSAWERVRAEHLPEHRVEHMLGAALQAPSRALTGSEAETWFTLSLFLQAEAGRVDIDAPALEAQLASLSSMPEARAFRIRLAALTRRGPQALSLATEELNRPARMEDFEAALAASMAALDQKEPELAAMLCMRQLAMENDTRPTPPRTPAGLLRLWADALRRRGMSMRSGFPYEPGLHLPCSASECLQRALEEEPEHLKTLRLLESMYEPVCGLEHARMGLLSTLTLHRRDDWRLLVKAAQANLRCFRAAAAREELLLARQAASRQGKQRAFERTLSGRDPSGRLASLLHHQSTESSGAPT